MNSEDIDEEHLYITPDANNVIFNGECLTRRALICNDCEAFCATLVYINLAYEEEELDNIKEANGTCGKCDSNNLSFKAID